MQTNTNRTSLPVDRNINEALSELEQWVFKSLETYSNVHRGSGYKSKVTTELYENARDIVLEYLDLDKSKYVVIFCTPLRAEMLRSQLKKNDFHILSSLDFGLHLAIRAMVVRRKALPKGKPFQTGGGTARLVAPNWIIWAEAPDKFEAGTPSIVNTIAFAKSLQMAGSLGKDVFHKIVSEKLSADEILCYDELEQFSGRKLLEELKNDIIGRGIKVDTDEGNRAYINLDNAASTPTFRQVWKAVCQTWRQNAEVHQEIIKKVKIICSGFLDAPIDEYDIIFASNTTEAINIAAQSFQSESVKDYEPVVLCTLLEHTSNDLPWRMISGNSPLRLKADREGFFDLIELETILSEYNEKCLHGIKRIKIVAVSGASNVLGSYNDLEKIAAIVHRYGGRILVDAAQMAAHRKIEMKQWGIDYLAFSAHKVYAPFGSGALIIRKELSLLNQSVRESINKSGEENITGIAAMGKAIVLLQRVGMDIIKEDEQALTARALHGLVKINGLIIYGVTDPDSPNFARKGGVIVFSMKNIWPDKLAKALSDKGGIGVRYGCHCAHLLVKHLLNVPHLLEQFQGVMLRLFKGISLPGVVRVSIGIGNNEEEIDKFIRVLNTISKKHRKK